MPFDASHHVLAPSLTGARELAQDLCKAAHSAYRFQSRLCRALWQLTPYIDALRSTLDDIYVAEHTDSEFETCRYLYYPGQQKGKAGASCGVTRPEISRGRRKQPFSPDELATAHRALDAISMTFDNSKRVLEAYPERKTAHAALHAAEKRLRTTRAALNAA